MMDYLNKRRLVNAVSLTSAVFILAGTTQAQQLLNKPAWLPQLSLGVKESYDDNIFGVSGEGMQPQGAWITSISPAIGFDFASLLGEQATFQTLSLNYTPDFVFFALAHNQAPYNEPSQNYDAHKFGTVIKGAVDDFSFSLSNAFLYNDGSKTAPTYAMNQSGAAGEFDKYRDHYAYVPSRERANQFQERETTVLEYDLGPVFIRPTDTLLLYDMNTALHNTSKAPYEGYQNFVDRYDINGGLDFGYKVATNLAVTVGYRYGSQYQQQFAPSITSDYTNYSSSTYQRVLFGLEGKPWDWLVLKLDGGPDFRDYNSHAPISNLHPTKYYAEASLSAAISANQSLTFNYKQFEWEASTGYIPTWDSSYDLDYHWNVNKRLGFDLDAKIQEYDATGGNDVATGTDPSLRTDRMYTLSPAATYAFTPQLSATLSYEFDAANNELYTLPAANHAGYRNFIHQVVSLGLLYKF
jgi:hypothetical protein